MAIEPEPEIFKALEKNINLIGSQATLRITPCQLALSNYTGQGTLNTSGRGGYAPSLQYNHDHFSGNVQVKADTAESLVKQGLPKPEIMKVDVEGHELEVLQGLGGLRPEHLFIELHPSYVADMYKVGYWLSSHSYEFVCGVARSKELMVQMRYCG